MWVRNNKTSRAVAGLILLWMAQLAAQSPTTTGSIQVVVADSTGSFVAGVRVTASLEASGASRYAETDSGGGLRFFGLPMPAAVVRWFMAGPDAPDAIVREVQRAVAAASPDVLAHRSAEALRVDVREEFAQLEVPVLVLAPTRDRLLRTDVAEEILALRPDAEVALVDAPHMVLQRCPHASLARIEEFLAHLGARPGAVP